jgi:uncharacterized protein (TIGR00255 family)
MKSMTGFGRGQAAGPNYAVFVELKTVNNRFLDIHLRLGAEQAALETAIKKLISSRLSRGRVDVALTIERTDEVAYELNRPLLSGYLRAMRLMQQEFGLVGDPDLNAIARLPGVMQPVREENNAELLGLLEAALTMALDGLETMRAAEGMQLAAEMESRLQDIETHLPVIEEFSATMPETYRAKLNKRISELLARDAQGVELDQARLAQEVAYQADRSDISEELARLRSHLSQFRQIMADGKEAGKKLDFLLQEINREANTALSKATDLNIKEAGLAIKGAAEKLREQVQNVE